MPRNTIAGNMENMDAEKDWRIRQGMIYGVFFSCLVMISQLDLISGIPVYPFK
jgi:hypothetical protein